MLGMRPGAQGLHREGAALTCMAKRKYIPLAERKECESDTAYHVVAVSRGARCKWVRLTNKEATTALQYGLAVAPEDSNYLQTLGQNRQYDHASNAIIDKEEFDAATPKDIAVLDALFRALR